jgi:hypothetical protein
VNLFFESLLNLSVVLWTAVHMVNPLVVEFVEYLTLYQKNCFYGCVNVEKHFRLSYGTPY